jgi:hypothetical protein
VRASITLCALLGAGIASDPPTAMAADLSFSGFFSQRIEADSNPDLESSDFSSPALNSVTDLGFIITARTPRTTLTFAPGVNATLQTDESLDFQRVNPRFSGSFTRLGKRLRLSGGLSLIPRLTNSSSSSFDDFITAAPDGPDGAAPPDAPDGAPPFDGADPRFAQDTTNATALEINASANVRATYSLDPLNSVSTGLTAQARRFSGDNGAFTDSDTFGVNLGWNHRVDPVTSVSLNSGFRLFSENGGGSADKTYDLSFGGNRRLSPDLNVSGNLGVTFISTSENNTVGLTGGAQVSYSGKNGAIGVGFSQSVDQNEFGDLENRSSVFVTPSYRVNSRTSFSVPLQATFTNPVFSAGGGASSDDDLTFSLGPSLSYAVTDAWRVNTGYRLRVESNSQDLVTSGLVFLQISRNLTLLP